MSLFSYPAKFTAGRDGRVLVEFIDLPRVATDGKDDREALEELPQNPIEPPAGDSIPSSSLGKTPRILR